MVSAGAQGANLSVIAPFADRLSNYGNVGLSYQYALNDMVGAAGRFRICTTNPTEVLGLYDPSAQGGLAFYSHRIARGQYVGVSYEYQRLLSRLNTEIRKLRHMQDFFFTRFLHSHRGSRSLSSAVRSTRILLNLLL